ncbi:TrkA family potassium uptake protein [Streptomyces finlayi]|uniref:Trk system potassium uptake protein TrkA n=1 Tax=Streptomyces finlayi TaxID=67296 RepID=A0A7G7BDG3_9ACTN|nr:TrkA family potassium uptake protein [Streptomyces finlayi]QNE73378.1 TrkA family potassium uptake protein [Streptomyces finlayi]
MRALIAGAGRLGARIAQVLASAGSEITLVESDTARVAALRERHGARLTVGDACEPTVLERAGARVADVVLATTDNDDDNLVISLLAKRHFAAPRVVALVNDHERAWLFDQRWGVDVAVPASTPLVSLIEEATGASDTVALLRLSKAGVDIIETVITSRSRAVGRSLMDIALPAGTVVATVVREGQPMVPEAALRVRAGDEILLVSHEAEEEEIHAAFQ